MSYTKPVQTGYTFLQPGELVVKLNDMTPVPPVAVRLVNFVDNTNGNIVIEAFARVVKSDGSDYLMDNGQTLKSTYQTSMDRAGVAAVGGAANLKKLMLLTVIGEDVVGGTNALGLKWTNPPDISTLAHANIRVNIQSAIDAAAADPSTLL